MTTNDIRCEKIRTFALTFDGVGVVSPCGTMWGSHWNDASLVVGYDPNDDTYGVLAELDGVALRIQFDLPATPTPTPQVLHRHTTDAMMLLRMAQTLQRSKN